jgi:hypothetical protein
MKYFIVEPFTIETPQGTVKLAAGKILELSEEQAARLGDKIKPATVPAFNQQEALDLIRRTHAELNHRGHWPEQLMIWLREKHPAARQAILNATQSIDDACLNQNRAGLERPFAV